MEITPLGDSAFIIRVVDELEANSDISLDIVLSTWRHLQEAAVPGVIDLAPAYGTIGVFYDPARVERIPPAQSPFDCIRSRVQAVLEASRPKRARGGKQTLIEIPVCYGDEFGPDLGEVARVTGLDEKEVIRRHSKARYRVACVGFVPGFSFLSGLPPELATPRRATPRKEIPAGAVGIGGAQTGIYPGKSPGGWNLIGRTPCRLFDVKREPASLLQAGARVRFRQISRMEFDSFPS